MKFTQPCLIMTVENKEIDWAMVVEPQEVYTKEDVSAQCDKSATDFFVYPLGTKTINTIAETMDYINSVLHSHQPQSIPGIFTL